MKTLLFIAAFLLSSCGSDDSGEKNKERTSQPVAVPSELEGSWLAQCELDDAEEPNSFESSRLAVSFSGDKVSVSFRSYEDENCNDLYFTTKMQGEFFLSGINAIDINLQEIFLSLHTEEGVESWNFVNPCEEEWVLNKEMHITEESCSELYSDPPTSYDIWKIENGQLFFGKFTEDFNGSSPDKRMQTYDETLVFERE